jgi:Fe-S oxidoreductase
MVQLYFNPSCALILYKPEMERWIMDLLSEQYRDIKLHKICCHNDPKLPNGGKIINACAGCDRRFRSLYPGVSTISIWELIDCLTDFSFPDYNGAIMTIQDPCPIRDRPEVHQSVRSILRKMNINLLEPRSSKNKTICCGDDFYPGLAVDKVNELMRLRAAEMPCEQVVVYCVSCIKAMHIGGKKPRFLIDLLFDETTDPQEFRTAEWHQQLDDYISKH